MSAGTRGDLPGRLIGMLVFLIGIGLLLLVFKVSYDLFTSSPEHALHMTITGDPKRDPGAAVIGSGFGWLLLRIGFLFVMAVSASLLSQKGINLYFSAVHGPQHKDVLKPTSTVSAEG